MEKVRFRLPIIIAKVENKWKRRLTTNQKRRYLLEEQITDMTKYYKEMEILMQIGVLDGTITSAVSDTEATSNYAPVNAPLQKWE